MKNLGSALSAVKKNYASVINRTQSLANPEARTAAGRRALGPGQIPKPQAPSFKHQASSPKLREHQATSVKPQAASVKLKPASVKLQDS